MSGKLTVIGLGPGSTSQLTPEASDALRAADVVYGYGPYLDRVPARAGQRRLASDNGKEIDRATRALAEAAEGASVAVVSGGDPGVFAMAAAVCEALERGPSAWRDLDLSIVPGITSMLAVAARVGAPLGHDFCALSLSNNLKPWAIVEQRLQAAASAGFAIALYNPISRARPWQLQRAFEILRAHLPANTPVVFGHAVGRVDERILVTTLEAADDSEADMATCIIVGSSETRLLARPNGTALVYTPRSVGAFST
jgi:precorrin-3B C17-methyltransferase